MSPDVSLSSWLCPEREERNRHNASGLFTGDDRILSGGVRQSAATKAASLLPEQGGLSAEGYDLTDGSDLVIREAGDVKEVNDVVAASPPNTSGEADEELTGVPEAGVSQRSIISHLETLAIANAGVVMQV